MKIWLWCINARSQSACTNSPPPPHFMYSPLQSRFSEIAVSILCALFSAYRMMSVTPQLPLKDSVIRASSLSFNPAFQPSLGRPNHYKSWDEEKLRKAYEAVQREGMTVRKAADAYCVSKSTLQDRISGRVAFGAMSGPPKYLTDGEEEELVNFLVGSASIGYARIRKQVIALVQSVMSRKGLDVVVSHGWWESFKRRHPNITVRTAEHLSYCRAVACSPEILDNYYDLLEQTLVDNKLFDSPSQIFNMDETGMPLEPDLPRVVAGRGQQHVACISSGNKAQITVTAACNAAGYVIPPMVVFDRKCLKPEMTNGEVPGTLYGLSNTG